MSVRVEQIQLLAAKICGCLVRYQLGRAMASESLLLELASISNRYDRVNSPANRRQFELLLQ